MIGTRRYAQVAKEIAASGDWLTSTWGRISFLAQTAALFLAVYKIVGINEFAARFSSAAFGFGVVALTFLVWTSLVFIGCGSNSSCVVVVDRSIPLLLLAQFCLPGEGW